ncbi:MAG: protein kinase [Planctomycetes bacterium]|nr:protein kinase [Planctomycetota bacterium]
MTDPDGSSAAPTGPDFGQRRDFYTFAPESLAQELPAFEVLREVGKGSMGLVYEARVRATGDRIALKVLPPSLLLTERALARFLREGRIMARVRHPDIVAFVDQGSRGRLFWFAMEFVDGVTLEERLRVGPLPVQHACTIAAQVGRALQFAHERGVVHRDVKPGNLMLRDGAATVPRVAITDFGLARETGTGSMTESGAIVGTPMFMAPEVVLGGTQAANTLADVYSLGATLYTMVAGRPPFEGPTAQSVLKAVLEQDPTPPHRLRADLPLAVEAMLGKAMAKNPAHRYGSALEFAEDLERFLRGEHVLARLPNLLQRGARWCRRRPVTAVLLVALLVLTLGAALVRRQQNRDAVERGLAEAERCLALASTTRDEQDRPRSNQDRRDLLLAAVVAATQAIERDSAFARAFWVRARAHHRLGQWADAIYDLDAAERLRGQATPEILHFRIDALQQQGDPPSLLRLQHDLTTLLQLDQSPRARALVAEQLLAFVEQAHGAARSEALARVTDVLAAVGDDDPRAAVARARRLELDGQNEAALAAMRAATARHAGNLFVHLQAAAMFDRNALHDEGARQHDAARRLSPEPPATARHAQPTVDLDGLSRFLGEVDSVLRALEPTATGDGATPTALPTRKP